MTLAQLRKALKEKQDALATLETKATSAEASDDDVAALDTSLNDIEKMEKRLGILERSEKSRAAAAKAATDDVSDDEEEDDDSEDEPAVKPKAQVKKDMKPAEKAGIILMGMAKAFLDDGRTTAKSTAKALDELGYGQIGNMLVPAKKSLNASSGAAGGVTIPTNLSRDILPLLYGDATFLLGKPKPIDMQNGNFSQVAGATGAVSGFKGELKPSQHSEATFRDIKMSAKIQYGMTSLSDHIMRYSFANMMAYAQSDLREAMSLTADYAAYFGSGTQYTPLGLLNVPSVPSLAMVAAAPIAPTTEELDRMGNDAESRMMRVKLSPAGSEWRMSYRTFAYMSNLRHPASGEFSYPELQTSNPAWRNKTVRWSHAFPDTINGNESVIALMKFPTIYYGQTLDLQFKMSDVASIDLPGGKKLNAFQDGATILHYTSEWDVALSYLEAVVLVTGVRAGG